jgi:hypothetical protein
MTGIEDTITLTYKSADVSVEVKVNAHRTWDDQIQTFVYFLRGMGYQIGNLEFYEEGLDKRESKAEAPEGEWYFLLEDPYYKNLIDALPDLSYSIKHASKGKKKATKKKAIKKRSKK